MRNAEDLLAHTQILFRELREAWFVEVVAEQGWYDMTEAQERKLNASNAAMRQRYDAQTERLLQGEPLSVTAWCDADIREQGGSDASDTST